MPIVEVELVTDTEPDSGLARALADEIGRAMDAPEGSTWVRLRVLDRQHYGESGGPLDDAVRPVFVRITARRRPRGQELAETARAITSAVARITGHPADNVHVVYDPDATGRIAFGGNPVS